MPSVTQGPGTNASDATKLLRLWVTRYLARHPGDLQRENAEELGPQFHLPDVGGASEVYNLNMPLSVLKQ